MLLATSTHAAMDNSASSTRPQLHLKIGDCCSDKRGHITHQSTYPHWALANQKECMNLHDISIRNAVRSYAAMAAIIFFVASLIALPAIHSFSVTAGDAASDVLARVGVAMLVGLTALLAGAKLLLHHISGRLDLVSAETENLRTGDGDYDLTRKLPTMSGALGRLCASLNAFIGQLHDLVANVTAGAQDVAMAARQISAGNTDLSIRTEQQASTLEETASSMEKFTSAAKCNAENILLASGLAASASKAAQRGGAVVTEAVAKITAANVRARKIGNIVATIDSIAFQTNILALNAAVEAARAGEQGLGFAVVAAEVRALAQRSAASAKEIKLLITDAIDQVDEGARLVGEAGSSMQDIIVRIEQAAAIMNDITSVTREQSAGIEQVNRAIMQLDDVTQQNAALVEQAAAAAESMREQAENLTRLVSKFKLHDQKLRASDGQMPWTPATTFARARVSKQRPGVARSLARIGGVAAMGEQTEI